jgi:hypothetical protein
MKTTLKQRPILNWPEKKSPPKRKNNVFQNINDFLILHPVGCINEFGEKIIGGKRIC